jgi:two-component system chemotaxis response regulator CheY
MKDTSAHSDSPRILVADDDFASRELLLRLLRQFTRAEVYGVRDGTAAVQHYLLLRPRITLLDIDMPEPDGMAVLEQIHATGDEAFVVMVSGHSKLEIVKRAVDLGVKGFVVKPYSARRVLEVLRHYATTTGDTAMLKEP